MPDAAPATRRTTPAALLVLALAALTLALPVAPAQGASHAASRARASHARTTHAASHAKKAHAKASRAKTARALVAAVTRARTPSAGGKALLAAMRRLHVAVDTRDGRALVRDGDVARHAFLYDFELRGLAAARARRARCRGWSCATSASPTAPGSTWRSCAAATASTPCRRSWSWSASPR